MTGGLPLLSVPLSSGNPNVGCNFDKKTETTIKQYSRTNRILKMIYKYLSFSIAITFISFIVGMAFNSLLKKSKIYNNKLSNLNFIKSEKANRWIGVNFIRWTVKNTPFKYFSQHLRLKSRIEKSDLYKLRNGMTSSEIDHLIGFIFVATFAVIKFYKAEWLFGLTLLTVNVLMNLHPSLLQQQNKRRIDKLIKRM